MANSPKILFIVGPTASGKTELAILAAQTCAGKRVEIINSDSVQVYRDVEIGTAKPTTEQRRAVPHHLIDVVASPQVYTAGRFRDDAMQIIEDGARRGVEWFFIVGGSGFYVQALEKGMFDVAEVDPRIRADLNGELKTRGLDALYDDLCHLDESYGEKIKPQDTYRILRALELMRAFNKTMTRIQAEFTESQAARGLNSTYEVHKIGLKPDRDELRKRVAQRTHSMIEKGLVAEVESLRSKGLSQWAPLQSVGYRETQMLLNGQIGRDQLADFITISTMQLAKRQMTWFKRDTETVWAPSKSGFAEALRLLPAF